MEAHNRCIRYIQDNDFKIRYTGALVADFQQILKHGGLYAYPATKDRPDGKIRLLFESAPLGFIAAQAGGMASDGRGDLLKIEPKGVGHKTPVYFGSRGLIEKLQGIMGAGS